MGCPPFLPDGQGCRGQRSEAALQLGDWREAVSSLSSLEREVADKHTPDGKRGDFKTKLHARLLLLATWRLLGVREDVTREEVEWMRKEEPEQLKIEKYK